MSPKAVGATFCNPAVAACTAGPAASAALVLLFRAFLTPAIPEPLAVGVWLQLTDGGGEHGRGFSGKPRRGKGIGQCKGGLSRDRPRPGGFSGDAAAVLT
jgi:hypothetical protein